MVHSAMVTKPKAQNPQMTGCIEPGFTKFGVTPSGGGRAPISARTEVGIVEASIASARWKTNGVMTVAFQKMRSEMLLMIKLSFEEVVYG
ncbi:hypothetical protein BOTCAL_0024g00480 [Botryotinia calthae]|uniref:Uncharacterized protein n=1 Tax=Botryotinia calthae TaxID=38488 RepID=A0A4Y8DGY6_9HELO|nr:hypothetical protein BOTCAL_0024g00480 [Botryotinia calthae]